LGRFFLLPFSTAVEKFLAQVRFSAVAARIEDDLSAGLHLENKRQQG
jgi:hypothetical protein